VVVAVEAGTVRLRLGNKERVALSVAEPVQNALSQASVLHHNAPRFA